MKILGFYIHRHDYKSELIHWLKSADKILEEMEVRLAIKDEIIRRLEDGETKQRRLGRVEEQ